MRVIGLLFLLALLCGVPGCQGVEAIRQEARAEGYRSGYRQAMSEQLWDHFGDAAVGTVLLGGVGLGVWIVVLCFYVVKPILDSLHEWIEERNVRLWQEREAKRVAKQKLREAKAARSRQLQHRENCLRSRMEREVRNFTEPALAEVAKSEWNLVINHVLRNDQQRTHAEFRRRTNEYSLLQRSILKNRELPAADRLQMLLEQEPMRFGSSA